MAPENAPKDEILQDEIAALYHLEASKDIVALSFRRRIAAGASIEQGEYVLEPSRATIEELEKRQVLIDFNIPAFDTVAWYPGEGITTRVAH